MLAYIVLVSTVIGIAHGSCATLATDLQSCFTQYGMTYSTEGTTTFSIYLNNCDKIDSLLYCWFNVLDSCSELSTYLGLLYADKTAFKAAYRGVCANKDDKLCSFKSKRGIVVKLGRLAQNFFDFDSSRSKAGLTCIQDSGVDQVALATSCINTVTLTSLITQLTSSSNFEPYCSFMVTAIDCYMNGVKCSTEFETLYKYYSLALLPSACRSYSNSYSPWIETYGHASSQKYSITVLLFAYAVKIIIPKLF